MCASNPEKGVPVTSIHRNAEKASLLGRWVNSLCRGSAEREAISLHARIEKLDLELSIGDGLRLADQLIHSLFANCAVAQLVNVNPVSGARRLSIDEHAKWHRQTSPGRSHHEVHVARMEPDRNPSGRLVEHCRVLGKRPDARGGPLVQAQPRWLGIVVRLVE